MSPNSLSMRGHEANRQNSKSSTGPLTRRGKKRVRRNSWKHGLAAGRLAKKIPHHKVETLAIGLVGKGAELAIRQAAIDFALAHLYWLEVQAVQAKILKRKLRAIDYYDAHHELVVQSLLASDPELRSLARYERRAFNRRLALARALNFPPTAGTSETLPKVRTIIRQSSVAAQNKANGIL
jgi:hypothetical protein